MKKIATLLMATILMTSFVGKSATVLAAEKTAYELCKSAHNWKEYKKIFEDFQYEREDFLGSILKELPEKTEDLSTFTEGIGYGGIKDEEVDKFADAICYATSLYNEEGYLRLSVKKKDLEGPYSQVNVDVQNSELTHIGNVVMCYGIPYYSCFDNYLCGKNKNYYEGQEMCYTCGIEYWNSNGTLEKMEYIPFDDVAQLKDSQKPSIDKSFDGTILILLCTTDSLLGWTSLEGLYQYEDGIGNMEFYNPDVISYK